VGLDPAEEVQDASGFDQPGDQARAKPISNAAAAKRGRAVDRADRGQSRYRLISQGAVSKRARRRLEEGRWLVQARGERSSQRPLPSTRDSFFLPTTLTPAQVRNSYPRQKKCVFLAKSRAISGRLKGSGVATAGYRAVPQASRLSRLLAAMVLLAAAVYLAAFRFGGCKEWFEWRGAGAFASSCRK